MKRILFIGILIALAVGVGLWLGARPRQPTPYQIERASMNLEMARTMLPFQIAFRVLLGLVALFTLGGLGWGAVRWLNRRADTVYPDRSGLYPIREGRVGQAKVFHDPNRTLTGTTVYAAGEQTITVQQPLPEGRMDVQQQVTGPGPGRAGPARLGQRRRPAARRRRPCRATCLSRRARLARRCPRSRSWSWSPRTSSGCCSRMGTRARRHARDRTQWRIDASRELCRSAGPPRQRSAQRRQRRAHPQRADAARPLLSHQARRPDRGLVPAAGRGRTGSTACSRWTCSACRPGCSIDKLTVNGHAAPPDRRGRQAGAQAQHDRPDLLRRAAASAQAAPADPGAPRPGGAPARAHTWSPIGQGREQGEWRSLLDTSHILVGGESRSGKSTWLNALLVALLAAHTPDELRLALIDPKGVEFAPFKRAPAPGAARWPTTRARRRR